MRKGMLVLTRRLGESIMIGEHIKVTLLEQREGRIKLGINAPGSVAVHREEVWLRIKEEQAADSRQRRRRDEDLAS